MDTYCRAILKKLGSGVGVTLPRPLLRELGLKVGQRLTVSKAKNGSILLTPKPRYIRAELLAQCNPHKPEPTDLQLWNEAKLAGREIR